MNEEAVDGIRPLLKRTCIKLLSWVGGKRIMKESPTSYIKNNSSSHLVITSLNKYKNRRVVHR